MFRPYFLLLLNKQYVSYKCLFDAEKLLKFQVSMQKRVWKVVSKNYGSGKKKRAKILFLLGVTIGSNVHYCC